MTYNAGSIGANANPGPALYADMETHLLAAGFTLVDTVVIGARTHKVLKSAAADNTLGLDWFLDVSYPTTGAASEFLMMPFEFFDPATDLGYRGVYATSNSTIEGTYFSRFGATGQALETQWASWFGFGTPMTTAAFGYYLSATTDRVVFALTNVSAELHYVGFFEPTAEHSAAAGSALYPLCAAHFVSASATPQASASSTSCTFGFTRVPSMASIAWATQGVIDLPYAQMSGQVGSLGAFLGNGKIGMARRPITMGSAAIGSTAGAIANGLGLVGYLIDVANTWTDGGIIRGDTLTDDEANTWVAVDDSNNTGLWFKAV